MLAFFRTCVKMRASAGHVECLVSQESNAKLLDAALVRFALPLGVLACI